MVSISPKYTFFTCLNLFLAMTSVSFSLLADDIVSFSKPEYHSYAVTINPKFAQEECQSLKHLKQRNNSIWDDKRKIDFYCELNQNLKDMFNKMLKKEIALNKKGYCTFNHAERREFLLLYYLFELLFRCCQKEKPNTSNDLIDFFPLRFLKNDDTIFSEYADEHGISNASTFLKKTDNFRGKTDEKPNISKCLFSVTPSIFNDLGNDSALSLFSPEVIGGAFELDFVKFCKDIFSYFGKDDLFDMYKSDLNELLDTLKQKTIAPLKKKINDYAGKKIFQEKPTGLMIQIGVPKKILNQVAYPCGSCGSPFIHMSATEGLNEPDIVQQFRLFLPGFFTDPTNPYGIKMFRYYDRDQSIEKFEEKWAMFAKKLKHNFAVEEWLTKALPRATGQNNSYLSSIWSHLKIGITVGGIVAPLYALTCLPLS